MKNPWLRALVGFTWGFLLFLGVAYSLKPALGPRWSGSAAVSQAALKGVLILVAVIAWKLLGRPAREMGWRGAAWWNWAYLVWFAVSAASMMAASVVLILMGTRHPVAAQLSFLQIVSLIWVLSSVSEEVYVRGLVQSWVANRGDAHGGGSPPWPSIAASTLLFAAMHVPLMWSSMGVKGGLVIVLAMLGLGLACAVLRARTGSLWPAIACHVIGNVAAIPGGILGVILHFLVYRRMPDFVTSG